MQIGLGEVGKEKERADEKKENGEVEGEEKAEEAEADGAGVRGTWRR